MNTDYLLLPDVLNPPDSVCLKITIPNDLGYFRAVDGAILRIAQWQAWQRDPLKLARVAAANMQAAYQSMEWISCSPADTYRINPENGCQWQVSHDEGVTWVLFWDATTCEPDIAHFLVDNPGVIRENGISPADGHFGILIVANNQVGIGVDGVQNFPAADFYQASVDDAAYPPLRLGRAAGGRGYLELVQGVTRRDAISYNMLFRAPIYSGVSLNEQNAGGIYVRSVDNRGYIVLPDGSGGYHQVRLGKGDGSGDGTLVDVTGDYALLADGETPVVTVTGSGDTRNVEVAFPHIPLPTVYSGEYDLLPAGDTPVIGVDTSIVDTSLSVVVKGKFPPIPLPTTFDVDTVVLDTLTAPELAIIDSSTSSERTIDIILRNPTPFDASLPISGTKHFTGIEIDAFGSTLPFKIPSGYSIDGVVTRGLWYFQRFLEAGSKFSNGIHEVGHDWPYYTDLVAQVTTGSADSDGFYAGEGSLFDIISDGFLASEDCYIKLEQSFEFTDGERKGEIYIDFDITAPSLPVFDWSFDFDFTGASFAADWQLQVDNGNDPKGWITGVGYSSGVSGWIVKLGTIMVGDATTFIERVEIYSTTLFPGVGTGNQFIMPEIPLTDTDPTACTTPTGHSIFTGIHQSLNGGRFVRVNSESYDHASETNDQLQVLTRVKLFGNGATPTFIPG